MSTLLGVRRLPWEGTGEGFQQEHTIRWEVQFAESTATELEAVDATGARNGSTHPANIWAIAYSANAVQQNDVCFWIVTVKYKTSGLTFQEEEVFTVTDPLQRTPIVRSSWSSSRVGVTHGTDGKAIENTAGQRPEQPFESDAPFLVFPIKANVATVPAWLATYRNRFGGAINEDIFRVIFQDGSFYQIDKGCAQISGVTLSEPQKDNGISYFVVEFTLTVKAQPINDLTQDGWCYDMLNTGRMERLPDVVATAWKQKCPLRCINGSDGQAVSEAVLLTTSGLALPASRGKWENGTEYVASEPQEVADGVAEAQLYGDVVEHPENSKTFYYCIETHTAATSTREPPNTTYWEKIPHIRYINYLPRKRFGDVLPGCKFVSMPA